MSTVRQGWRRTGVITAAGMTALLGAGVFAAPASAHTPVWSVTCDKVTVDLTQYNGKVKNEVTIKVAGKDILTTTEFGTEFHKVLSLPQHSSPVNVELIVHAGDSDLFSRDETKTSPVCEVTPSPTPTTTKPTPTTPAPTTSAPTAPAPGTPSPSPSDHLAQTGGSSSTPVIAGVAAVVLAAGAGLVVVSRRRRPARH